MSKRSRAPLIPAIVALIALGVGAEIWYSRRAPESEKSSATKGEPGLTSETPAAATPLPSNSIAPRIPPPLPRQTVSPQPRSAESTLEAKQETFAPPDRESLMEIDKVSLMLRDYRTLAGENPVGTNAEIMAAIMGDNPKQAKLGPPEGMPLNEKGELLDRWGTPYFFHQLSKDHMEIRSAGPDKILWTEDDPVIR